MEKVLIELILTNQCNKRCSYCDLDFKNKSFSFLDLDLFVNFIRHNPADYTLNFFGGEPLLEFKKLQYVVEETKGCIKKYSVGTNGYFLNKEILDFFLKHNIYIYLSIDNVTMGVELDFNIISQYHQIIIINFINDPYYLQNSLSVMKKLVGYNFNHISFMPVFTTKKWRKTNLKEFAIIYNFIRIEYGDISLKAYTYFNGVSIDRQFILDTDLYFYSDIDSLLWLQKQYNIITEPVKRKIEEKTKLFSLKSNYLTLEKLINLYNIEEVLRLIFEIPKSLGCISSYKIINKILGNES